MKEWDGNERRSGMIYEIKTLTDKVDLIQSDMKLVQGDVKAIRDMILGDGKSAGVYEKVNMLTGRLNDHVYWDRWLMGLLISSQVFSLYKMTFK